MTPLSRNQISSFLGRIVQDVDVLRAALQNNGTNEDNSAEELQPQDYLHIQAGLDRAKEAIEDAVLASNRSTEGNFTPETTPQGTPLGLGIAREDFPADVEAYVKPERSAATPPSSAFGPSSSNTNTLDNDPDILILSIDGARSKVDVGSGVTSPAHTPNTPPYYMPTSPRQSPVLGPTSPTYTPQSPGYSRVPWSPSYWPTSPQHGTGNANDAPASPAAELPSLHAEPAQVQGNASRRSSPQSLKNPSLSSPRASLLCSPIRFRRALPSFSPPSFPTPTRASRRVGSPPRQLGSAIRRPASHPTSSPTLRSTPLAPSSRAAFYWPMIHASAHGARRGTTSSSACRATLSGSTVGDKGSFLLDAFVGHVSDDDLSESDGEELEDVSPGGAARFEAAPFGQERGWKRKAASTERDGPRAAKHRRI